jgi:hypothetical protein
VWGQTCELVFACWIRPACTLPIMTSCFALAREFHLPPPTFVGSLQERFRDLRESLVGLNLSRLHLSIILLRTAFEL